MCASMRGLLSKRTTPVSFSPTLARPRNIRGARRRCWQPSPRPQLRRVILPHRSQRHRVNPVHTKHVISVLHRGTDHVVVSERSLHEFDARRRGAIDFGAAGSRTYARAGHSAWTKTLATDPCLRVAPKTSIGCRVALIMHLSLALLPPRISYMVKPPAAVISSPVSQKESSEARNTAMREMSRGTPARPNGVVLTTNL